VRLGQFCGSSTVVEAVLPNVSFRHERAPEGVVLQTDSGEILLGTTGEGSFERSQDERGDASALRRLQFTLGGAKLGARVGTVLGYDV
jgi:hypothetical protein